MSQDYQLSADRMTLQGTQEALNFESTADLSPLDEVIGQKRAVEAVDFGLNMETSGYHIFVTGDEGTGKSTIIQKIVRAHASEKDTSDDICLVHNFDNPSCPVPICLPSGKSLLFKQKMTRFIEEVKARIPDIFDSESFQDQTQAIEESFSGKKADLLKDLEKTAAKMNIGIARSQNHYQPVPLENGQPMSQESFDKLSPEDQERISGDIGQISEKLEQSMAEIARIEEEMHQTVSDIVSKKVEAQISKLIAPLMRMSREVPAIEQYVQALQRDIVENTALFLGSPDQGPKKSPEEKQLLDMARELLKRYQVNILVCHRKQSGAPVIFDANPNFASLFGTIENHSIMGATPADFTMVQAGSLLNANHGYLIMEIDALVSQPLVWEKLKTCLHTQKLQMEASPDRQIPGNAHLRPMPIDIRVKVILMGSYETFRIIQGVDARFNKLFKVRADFDNEVALTDEVMNQYSRFIAGACKSQSLLPFSKDAVARVIEFGCRLVSDQSKLSLRFGKVISILKEADYWARKNRQKKISEQWMDKAINEFRFRHNLYEEKVHQGFVDGSVLMDVDGEKVGQVNALAVYQLGEISFGRPSRITAESYMGKPGIINIEHEADLSGQTHDKGVMIISGFLGRMFAQEYPLSVSISITFEQSYSGVDGDSASSTELYAVLSSLSGVPIRQGIAVTGSVNQKGQIQAIGGVNEKIEGFYDVCRQNGLNGSQGVMIPASNVKNLMLRKEVIQDIEKGQFHIYAVSTIEEGIQVLFGIPAGQKTDDHQYEQGTVFNAVQATLKKFYDRSKSMVR